MAKIIKECLNEKCSTQLEEDMKWCCMECKKQFLLDNYSPNATIRTMKESQDDFKERQKKVLQEIKESGLSIRDFLLTLGDFKED